MEAAIRLPDPTVQGGPPVWQVMADRRSARAFRETAMPLEVLSQLLWSTHGTTGHAGSRRLRTAPSAGACYPIDAYVVANRVRGLEPGLYRYLTEDHALLLMRKGEVGAEVSRAALGQAMCRKGAVTLLWTAVVPRTTGRYGERGFRYIFMDAGHVGQNTYLAAAALGYGCCTIGAFDDGAMNAILGVEGKIETTVYGAAIGALV